MKNNWQVFLKKQFQNKHACCTGLHLWKTQTIYLLVFVSFWMLTKLVKNEKKFNSYIGQKSTVSFTTQCWSSGLQTKPTLESVLVCYTPEHTLLNFPILKNQTSQTDTNAEIPFLLQILEGPAALKSFSLLRDDFSLRHCFDLTPKQATASRHQLGSG